MTRAQTNDRPSLPPRFSMLKSLTVADFITLINAVSGVSSIFSSLSYARDGQPSYLWSAMALVCVAGVADFMDGRVARRSRRISTLGGDLDSLADLISFGVAPATLAFAVGMDGGWDWAVLVYFVCCGLSRLARYNVTADELSDESGKVSYFEGTPIPTSLVLVLIVGALTVTGRIHENLPLGSLRLAGAVLHPLVALFLLSGSLMISARLRVPKP
jgi:CDP-diacylglycerol---serine O-phosphatidyltransferase